MRLWTAVDKAKNGPFPQRSPTGARRVPVTPTMQTSRMPLAHPVSAAPTANFGQPAVAISFALARPGETVEDFRTRIASRGEWGQTRYGRDKVELVLTEESVERLAILIDAVGRT